MQFSSGATALSLFPPNYYRPKTVDHLAETVAQVATLFPTTPFFYYHFPMFNGLDYTCFDVLRLTSAICPNVVGAKFTDRDMVDM